MPSYLGSVDYWEQPQGVTGLFAETGLIFFAFQGFESMVKFSEETKTPESTIPKALILALIISLVLYILVALSAVSVAGWQSLAASGAPFAGIVSGTLGSGGAALIIIIALFATANTVLLSLYASTRLLFLDGLILAADCLFCMDPPDQADPVDCNYCLRGPVSRTDIYR